MLLYVGMAAAMLLIGVITWGVRIVRRQAIYVSLDKPYPPSDIVKNRMDQLYLHDEDDEEEFDDIEEEFDDIKSFKSQAFAGDQILLLPADDEQHATMPIRHTSQDSQSLALQHDADEDEYHVTL